MLPKLNEEAARIYNHHNPLRERVPLSKRKIIKKLFYRLGRPFLTALALLGSALVCLLLFFKFDPNDPGLFLSEQEIPLVLVSVAIASWLILSALYESIYWKTYFYDVDLENLYLSKGIIAKREAILPFSRITDVYLDRDLFDVALGLWDLHISTPTIESGKFAHIDGLSKAGAEKIRKILLEGVSQHTLTSSKHSIERMEDTVVVNYAG